MLIFIQNNHNGFGKKFIKFSIFFKLNFFCRFQWNEDVDDVNIEIGILLTYELRNYLFLLDYLV